MRLREQLKQRRQQGERRITSKPFNSKQNRADGRDEYTTIWVEDDLKPQVRDERQGKE